MSANWKAPRNKSNGSNTDLPAVARVAEYREAKEPYADEAEISLYDIWQVLSRHRLLVVGSMLLAGLLSVLAAWLMTPMYRAEVLLVSVTDLDEGDHYMSPFKEFGNVAALAGINLNRRDSKSESIATLKSRKFSEQFIQDNKLDRVLFSDLWDEKKKRWVVTDDADIPTSWDTYEVFDKSIRRVREDQVTGLVTLSIEWEDPDVAAQWANELVSRVNATLRQQAVDESSHAITYLQEQLARTSVVDLQQVLHRLIESEMKKTILANINEAYAFKVIDPATAPEEPFKPRVLLIIILSTTIGLILGVVLALILNAVRGEPGSEVNSGAKCKQG
jgi:uncharacterized protein involved in exopolysaccharide biosynthesis